MKKIIILFFTLLFAFKGKSQMIWVVQAQFVNVFDDSVVSMHCFIDWGGRDSSEYSNIKSISIDQFQLEVTSAWLQTSPIDDTPCVFIAKSKPSGHDEMVTQLNLMPIDDNLFVIIVSYKGNNWCTILFDRNKKYRKEDATTINE